tara:strand:- start:9962 stop:10318 length:357 start_codon:yes stop_codon:yes gene_type:complete
MTDSPPPFIRTDATPPAPKRKRYMARRTSKDELVLQFDDGSEHHRKGIFYTYVDDVMVLIEITSIDQLTYRLVTPCFTIYKPTLELARFALSRMFFITSFAIMYEDKELKPGRLFEIF